MHDDWIDLHQASPERATTHRVRFQRRILMWTGQVVLGCIFGAALGIALATSHTPGQLAFSSDGLTVIGSVNGYFWSEPNDPLSSYGVIKLWDVATGETLNRIVGPAKWLRSFTLSPDGSSLAMAGDSPSIELWDLGQGIRKGILSGHLGNIREVAFSPSGTILASTSHDGEVRIWDLATGQSRLTIHVNEYGADGLIFAPDGKTLVTSDWDNVLFWDVNAGRLMKQVDGYRESSPKGRYALRFLGYTDEGKNFLLSRHEGRHGQIVTILDGATGIEKFAIKRSSHLLALSPDGRAIAVGDRSGNVSLLDAFSGRVLLHPEGLKGEVRCITFSTDGKWLAAGDDGGRVCLWETGTGKLRTSITAGDPLRRWGLTMVVILAWLTLKIRHRYRQGQQPGVSFEMA
jgi:WD40 repeat protein